MPCAFPVGTTPTILAPWLQRLPSCRLPSNAAWVIGGGLVLTRIVLLAHWASDVGRRSSGRRDNGTTTEAADRLRTMITVCFRDRSAEHCPADESETSRKTVNRGRSPSVCR